LNISKDYTRLRKLLDGQQNPAQILQPSPRRSSELAKMVMGLERARCSVRI
jgi:hypothetical protein